jgi:hypothetical protein
VTDIIEDESETAADDPAVDDAPDPEPARWWPRPTVLVLGLSLLAVGIPLAVSLGVRASPRWYPVSDFAQIELHVRDISDGHVPLVGAAGRFYGLEGRQQGNHPGPIGFYALFPFYKLAGSSPWGLLLGTASLNLAAVATSIAIAYRRGGRLAALGMAAALAVLAQAYGEDKLVEPWNPYMAIMWWVAFLLAGWAVLCDDLALLPVAVVAGTMCAQLHVSYLGLVAGVAAVLLGVTVIRWIRSQTGRLLRWGALSAGLLLGLWVPPLLDLMRHDPSNAALIRYSFVHPFEARVASGVARNIWLAHLNPWVLASQTRGSVAAAPEGPIWPGLLVLAVWLGGMVLLARRRSASSDTSLWRLHFVVATALVLGLVSMTEVHGPLFDYLFLWAWGTLTLLLLATVWTYGRVLQGLKPSAQLVPAGVAGSLAVLVLGSSALTVGAAHGEHGWSAEASRFSRGLQPQLIDSLNQPGVPGGGHEGRYLFRWDEDSFALDWTAWGVLDELDRGGFDVGVEERVATPAGAHRVRAVKDATAVITYVLEPEIEQWRALPDATELAYFEPRSASERREYRRLQSELAEGLSQAGLDQLVADIDLHLMLVSLNQDVPDDLRPKIARMFELGQPVAVFAAPVDVHPPD